MCRAQGMSIDDSELREYTHGLFGSMAAVLKQDFQPYLATCVAAALASCEQVSPCLLGSGVNQGLALPDLQSPSMERFLYLGETGNDEFPFVF